MEGERQSRGSTRTGITHAHRLVELSGGRANRWSPSSSTRDVRENRETSENKCRISRVHTMQKSEETDRGGTSSWHPFREHVGSIIISGLRPPSSHSEPSSRVDASNARARDDRMPLVPLPSTGLAMPGSSSASIGYVEDTMSVSSSGRPMNTIISRGFSSGRLTPPDRESVGDMPARPPAPQETRSRDESSTGRDCTDTRWLIGPRSRRIEYSHVSATRAPSSES